MASDSGLPSGPGAAVVRTMSKVVPGGFEDDGGNLLQRGEIAKPGRGEELVEQGALGIMRAARNGQRQERDRQC